MTPELNASQYRSQLKARQSPVDCPCLEHLPPRVPPREWGNMKVAHSSCVQEFSGGSPEEEKRRETDVEECCKCIFKWFFS